MVAALYALILTPVVIYVIFTIIEITLTFRIAALNHSRSLIFVQASTEVTHTILAFAYAQFMITFSSLLTQIGGTLYWPLALFMATLIARGSLYLLLFYRERPARWSYLALLISYVLGVASVIWALMIVIRGIIDYNFIPYTTDVPLILGAGLPALGIFLVPIVVVYAHALKKLHQ